MANTALAHEFRKARAHQRSLWSGGGMISVEPSGRTERTFASAPFGLHAVSAFTAAKRAVFFREDLKRTLAASAKRSKAAKKAWKARKAGAA